MIFHSAPTPTVQLQEDGGFAAGGGIAATSRYVPHFRWGRESDGCKCDP